MAPTESSKDRCETFLSLKDVRSAVFWRDCAVEFLASATLLAFICFALVSNNTELYRVSTTHVAVSTTFVVYLIIEAYGPFSGAHMNTAITLSLLLHGKISIAKGIIYMVVQIVGCAAGSGFVFSVTPVGEVVNATTTYHAFNPYNAGLSLLQGVAVEAFVTFNLIFVFLSCTDSKNRLTPAAMPSLACAFAIGCGIMAAGTHTGATMNPLVAVGPALLAGDFSNHWVYWVGPLTGSSLPTGLYKLLIFVKKTSTQISHNSLQRTHLYSSS